MFRALKEQLNSELKQWNSSIKSISREGEQFTTPSGEVLSGLPDFIRVVVESSCGDGSFIKHEVWLPDDWNGCFIGSGNGGMAGIIVYTTLAEYIKMGSYAVTNTDMGTSDGEARGVKNPDVHRDFGWRATYIMTVVGKLIVQAYYKKEIRYSYFIGRSTGGQQALSMAQRYPNEYDGIVAGVPGNNRINLHTYFLWIFSVLKRSGVVFSQEELERVSQSAIDFSEQLGFDGPEEHYVLKPQAVDEYIGGFIAYLQKHNTDLSKEKLEALKKIYIGPINPRTGEIIHCGLPIGSELKQCGIWEAQKRIKAPSYFYPFQWVFGLEYNWADFDFDKDLETVRRCLSPEMDANEADISLYLKKGGKLLIYSGGADSCVPFPDAIKYYNRVLDAIDAEAAAKDGIRYFLIPSMGHEASFVKNGSAVMNEDTVIKHNVDVIRAWHERGIVPNSFDIVTDDPKAERKTKRIFAYGTKENPRL